MQHGPPCLEAKPIVYLCLRCRQIPFHRNRNSFCLSPRLRLGSTFQFPVILPLHYTQPSSKWYCHAHPRIHTLSKSQFSEEILTQLWTPISWLTSPPAMKDLYSRDFEDWIITEVHTVDQTRAQPSSLRGCAKARKHAKLPRCAINYFGHMYLRTYCRKIARSIKVMWGQFYMQ